MKIDLHEECILKGSIYSEYGFAAILEDFKNAKLTRSEFCKHYGIGIRRDIFSKLVKECEQHLLKDGLKYHVCMVYQRRRSDDVQVYELQERKSCK